MTKLLPEVEYQLKKIYNKSKSEAQALRLAYKLGLKHGKSQRRQK